MRPTRRIQDLDTRHYPLATTPTPVSLRKIQFSVNGKQAVFNEAEDANMVLEQLDEELQMLQESDGAIRTTQSFEPWLDMEVTEALHSSRRGSAIERPVSPESIT